MKNPDPGQPYFVQIKSKEKAPDCFDYRHRGLIFKRPGCPLTHECEIAHSGRMRIMKTGKAIPGIGIVKEDYCSGYLKKDQENGWGSIFEARLSVQERKVLETTVELWNEFNKLDSIHPDEQEEFRHKLHDLQHIIMTRPTARVEGYVWTQTGPIIRKE